MSFCLFVRKRMYCACPGAGHFADSGCDRFSIPNSVSFPDACTDFCPFSFGCRNTRTFGFAGGDSGGNQM